MLFHSTSEATSAMQKISWRNYLSSQMYNDIDTKIRI